jgi:hypothetical protein
MAIEFTNGASVHEIWADLPNGTCIAQFQYFTDAVDFAKVKIVRASQHVKLFVVNHYDGQSQLVCHPKEEAK